MKKGQYNTNGNDEAMSTCAVCPLLYIEEKRLREIVSSEINKALLLSMVNYARTVVNMMKGVMDV